MFVRHLHRRTRPFRYWGFWALAGAFGLLAGPMLTGQARTPLQVIMGTGFCAAWPWAADWWRRRGPSGAAARFEALSYTAECLVVGMVLAWVSAPPLAAFAAGLCLLGGGTALAGWRLLLPAAAAGTAGAIAGLMLAPDLTAASTAAADLVALGVVLGFTLVLAHLSFRQAERLHGHRQALAEKSAALERVNARLQRYLPPSLRDRVARAPDEPCRWERRWLTVAFVDLVGFTELSERLEAELLAGILDEYLGALVPAAERRGGEVSKLLGDGVLVVFAPRRSSASDAQAERRRLALAALAYCRELPTLLESLAAGWRSRGEPVTLRMRAGVASGFCTVGDRGGGGRLDFTVIGSPVNLASRLQAHAEVNGVLLDEATAALTEGGSELPEPQLLEAPQLLDVKGLGATPAYALRCRRAS